jgi:hypothetical protein
MYVENPVYFLIRMGGGVGVKTGSTRHVGHWMAYCKWMVFVMMENLVQWRLTGETEVLGGNLPKRHFVNHKSHLPDPGSNPGRCGGKPATNRLSYGAGLIPSLVYQILIRSKTKYFSCWGITFLHKSTICNIQVELKCKPLWPVSFLLCQFNFVFTNAGNLSFYLSCRRLQLANTSNKNVLKNRKEINIHIYLPCLKI